MPSKATVPDACVPTPGACPAGRRRSVHAGDGPFTSSDHNGPLSKMIVDTKWFSLLFCDKAEPTNTLKTWMRKSSLERMGNWRGAESSDSPGPPGPGGQGTHPSGLLVLLRPQQDPQAVQDSHSSDTGSVAKGFPFEVELGLREPPASGERSQPWSFCTSFPAGVESGAPGDTP